MSLSESDLQHMSLSYREGLETLSEKIELLNGEQLTKVIKKATTSFPVVFSTNSGMSYAIKGSNTAAVTNQEQIGEILGLLDDVKEGKKVLYYLCQKKGALIASVCNTYPGYKTKLLVFCKGSPYHKCLSLALAQRLYYGDYNIEF